MRTMLAIVLCMAASSLCAQTGAGPDLSSVTSSSAQLSRDFKEAGTDAYQVIVLVPYMSASEAEYQPRYFEAQKLLAAAKRKAQTAEDKAAFAILESMLSLRSLAIGYDRAHDIEGLKKAATAQFQCTYEAHSYFDQTPFPERFRKANDEALQRRTCVAGYNQIVKEIENK